MAGICFWIVMFPMDAIKSRIQVFTPNISIIKYTLQVIRNEGNKYYLIFMNNTNILYIIRFHNIICWIITNTHSYLFYNWYFIHHL